MKHVPLEELSTQLKPRAASSILLWAIAAFFLIIILWAAFTQLDRTIHGAGRVVPTAQLQVVSNLEGGIVREILVRPGAQVGANAPLIRLDPTLTGADYNVNQASAGALQAKIARLEAEIAGRTPSFPASTDPVVQEQVGIERALYISRQSELAGLTAAGNAQVAQSQRAVAEAQANLEAARAARIAAQAQAEALRPLVANGIEPRMSLVQADRQAQVSASQVAQASASIARAQAGVAEARATLAQNRQDWRAKAGAEYAAAQAELAAKRQSAPALEDRVSRTTVRAPLAGRINRVLVSTVGGTVRPGEPLVEIVPAERGLTIETRVRPSDIAFVRMNQRALVKITAYDYAVYGGLEGNVVGISPDSTLEERTGESYYVVRVRTRSDALLDQLGRKLPIGPGMIADVNLIGDKRSILSYLLTPFTRLSESAFTER